MTPEQRLRFVREELERRSRHGVHPIIPYDVRGEPGWRTGRCALCDRPVSETADYRTGRYRHDVD